MKYPKPPANRPPLATALLPAILDAADSLIVVLDRDGRIEVFNRACETATGFDSDQVLGRRIWDVLIPEEQIDGVEEVFQRLRGGDHPIRHENDFLTNEGGRKTISWSSIAITNDAGEVVHVVGTGIDLTAVIEARTTLDASETLYSALVETMTDGLVVDDLDGNITYANDTICRMLGYTRDELIGSPLADFVDEASGRILAERNENRSTETSTEGYQLTFRARDGSTLLVLVSPQCVVDADGRTTGTFAILTDITAITRMEQDQTLLATAIEQAAEAIVITDAEGTIEYVNPAFEQITGYTCEEAMGANPRILKSGKHDDAFYRDLWETIGDGRVWSGRFSNLKKDGTLFEEEATISPVRDEQDEIIAFVAVKRDVTTETELTQQLNRSQRFEVLSQLAGGIAHDFNNLLTTVAGSAELLLLRFPESSGVTDELTTTIRETVVRGAELTNQLLAVAQRQVVEIKVIDLNDAVLKELETVRRMLPETIKIDYRPGSGPLAILGDRGQLAQILLNLCVNARDAMPDGGLITVSTTELTADAMLLAAHPEARVGRYARLSIRDTGVGMDPDARNRAFDPLFSSKSGPGSSGLGLATVFGIVRQLHGMIDLESSPGSGSKFDLFFPLTSESLEETKLKPERETAGGGETILVVEDEARVRQIQKRMLEALGYTVLEAENGRVALDILDRKGAAVDMVFSDVTMPEMGGQELLDLARPRFPDLVFVFTSGYIGRDFLDRLGQGGETVHFIAKPFSMAQLAAIIREALAG